jgi:hypothetical protein
MNAGRKLSNDRINRENDRRIAVAFLAAQILRDRKVGK